MATDGTLTREAQIEAYMANLLNEAERARINTAFEAISPENLAIINEIVNRHIDDDNRFLGIRTGLRNTLSADELESVREDITRYGRRSVTDHRGRSTSHYDDSNEETRQRLVNDFYTYLEHLDARQILTVELSNGSKTYPIKVLGAGGGEPQGGVTINNNVREAFVAQYKDTDVSAAPSAQPEAAPEAAEPVADDAADDVREEAVTNESQAVPTIRSEFTTVANNINGHVAHIQLATLFAQNGDYPALDGVEISRIDNLYGRRTAAGAIALGLGDDAAQLRRGSPSFADQKEAINDKIENDPAFAAAVVGGLRHYAGLRDDQTDVPSREYVESFLKWQGVDLAQGVDAAIDAYAQRVGVNVQPPGPTEAEIAASEAEKQALLAAAQGRVNEAQGVVDALEQQQRTLATQLEEQRAELQAIRDRGLGARGTSRETERAYDRREARRDADILAKQEEIDETIAAQTALAGELERAQSRLAEAKDEFARLSGQPDSTVVNTTPERAPAAADGDPTAEQAASITTVAAAPVDERPAAAPSATRSVRPPAPSGEGDMIFWTERTVAIPAGGQVDLMNGPHATHEQRVAFAHFESLPRAAQMAALRDGEITIPPTEGVEIETGLFGRAKGLNEHDVDWAESQSHQAAKAGAIFFENGHLYYVANYPEGHAHEVPENLNSYEGSLIRRRLTEEFVEDHTSWLSQQAVSVQHPDMQMVGNLLQTMAGHTGYHQYLEARDTVFNASAGLMIELEEGGYIHISGSGENLSGEFIASSEDFTTAQQQALAQTPEWMRNAEQLEGIRLNEDSGQLQRSTFLDGKHPKQSQESVRAQRAHLEEYEHDRDRGSDPSATSAPPRP